MPPEQSSDVKFEIGHVLFIDIVGYSKLLNRLRAIEVNRPYQINRAACFACPPWQANSFGVALANGVSSLAAKE